MTTNFHISATLNSTSAGRYAFSATIEGQDVVIYTDDCDMFDYFDLYGDARFPISDELREEFEDAKVAYEAAEEAYDAAEDNEIEAAKAAYEKAEEIYENLRRELEEAKEEIAKYEENTNRVIRELLDRVA